MGEYRDDEWGETPQPSAWGGDARPAHAAGQYADADYAEGSAGTTQAGSYPDVSAGDAPYAPADSYAAADPYAPADDAGYAAAIPSANDARYGSDDPYAAGGAGYTPASDARYGAAQPAQGPDATQYVGRAAAPRQAAGTQRRPYVDAPPQQSPYIPGEDDVEGGGAVVSHRASTVWIKRIAGVAAAIVIVIAVLMVGSCVLNGQQSVADAGSNAVGSSDLHGGSGSSSNSGSSSSSSGSDSSGSSSSDSSARDTGSSIGSSVGSAIGGAAGNAVEKLGNVDMSGIAEQLGSAASSLSGAASDLAGAAGDLIGQLTSN